MPELSPEVLILLVLLAVGYYTVEKVKAPVKHAGKEICHVVTLGHKCKQPAPVVVVAP